jgi:hypothetical protein
MSKKLIIFFLVLCSVSALKAQKVPVHKTPAKKATAQKTTAQIPDPDSAPPALSDIPLLDRNWLLISKKEYKKVADNKYAVVFPAALQAMNNKVFNLKGYMVPMQMGMKHSTFMFAVLPLAQCAFCGMSGIPDMIEIHTAKPISYTDEPITISGKLVLKSEVYESNLVSNVVYPSNILVVDAKSM